MLPDVMNQKLLDEAAIRKAEFKKKERKINLWVKLFPERTI